MSHIYKKDINRSFSYKESLRRHYEQHFNYALNQHRCTEKLPDGTPCPYNCKRSDHLDRHREKIHALSRADKGKQNRRAIAYHGEELDENGVAIAYHGEEGTQHAIQFSNENNIELNLREGDQGCIRLQAIQLEEHQGEGGTTQTVQAIPVVTTAQSINGQTIITQQLPEGTTGKRERVEWAKRVKTCSVVNEKGETLVVQQVSQQVEVSQMEMDEVKPLKNEVVDDWIIANCRHHLSPPAPPTTPSMVKT